MVTHSNTRTNFLLFLILRMVFRSTERCRATHCIRIKNIFGKGMILKDATPFNIQFVNGKPLFIDTLSFESV
jgi:hypothetical protein